MSDSWDKTQARLKKWQTEGCSAWELRRVLSESEHLKVIATGAMARSKEAKAGRKIAWNDWWGFYLEKTPEKEAVQMLLDAWNKDVWGGMSRMVSKRAHEIMFEIAEQSRVSFEFSSTVDALVASISSKDGVSGKSNDNVAGQEHPTDGGDGIDGNARGSDSAGK